MPDDPNCDRVFGLLKELKEKSQAHYYDAGFGSDLIKAARFDSRVLAVFLRITWGLIKLYFR